MEKEVDQMELRKGSIKSCGCLQRERGKTMLTKHGLWKKNERLYSIWANMKSRCLDTKDVAYDRYGGRGIKICNEWFDINIFYQWAISHGYQKTLQIDRIDNDGNYCPENCRWITVKQQARNRRSNRILKHEERSLLMCEWSELTGIPLYTIKNRIDQLGWYVEKTLTTPPRKQKNGRCINASN
jgi:hypothetical protein